MNAKPGGKAARRMIRNAVNREIGEARQRTIKLRRQQKDMVPGLVAEVQRLSARVAELERQFLLRGMR